jgi:hypothetical protein
MTESFGSLPKNVPITIGSNTAKLYAQLGLTQYAAMEAFVQWKF